MDLDEMKSLWGEMTQKVEQQQLLNDKMILQMTQLKYSNKMNQLLRFEMLALLINILAGIYIIINFGQLDTAFLQFCGAYLIFAFLISSPFSTLKIQQMKNIDLSSGNFKETISLFIKKKKELFFIQKSYFVLGLFVAILGLPVYVKLVFKTYIDFDMTYWVLYIIAIILFMFVLSIFLVRSYNKMTQAAEDVLKELEI